MIRVELRPNLRVSRGKLVSGGTCGAAVHAASYLRRGHIILDCALVRQPRELKRIFIHELFHFVWWKLGNRRRLGWERVLRAEMARGARGELGWSAEIRKKKLLPRDIELRTRLWREYCCESFCDSGAALYSGQRKHSEFTLAATFRAARLRWLSDIIENEEDLVHFANPAADKNLRWGSTGLPPGLSGLFPHKRSTRPVRVRDEAS